MSEKSNHTLDSEKRGGPVNSDASYFRGTKYPIDYEVVPGVTCHQCGSGEVWQFMQTMDMPMKLKCLRCGMVAPSDAFPRSTDPEGDQPESESPDETDRADQYPTDGDGYPLVPEEDVIGVFPRDRRWGHRITFRDYEDRRVDGHISPPVSDGDLFAYQLESGRIGVYELTNVDNKLDPRDMFFADAEDFGYLEGHSDAE